MKSAGKARSNGLYRHIRTSKEIIRNLLNDLTKIIKKSTADLASPREGRSLSEETVLLFVRRADTRT